MRTDLTDEETTVACTDFDGAVEAFRRALEVYVTGNPAPVMALVSRRDDVTLSNPLGPPRRGPGAVDEGIAEGASFLRGGTMRGIEEVARYSTPDLGYVVQLERTQAYVAGGEDLSNIALRVTLIFRREGDNWKLAHRHADPITTPRSIMTAVEA